ncbi:hypothetical protein GALMADRAFT_253570 [Galerina marginata CBS 339.88]|uniref:BTB domain-containing protein n=1 Tax=Galerina marginata (strain CBS 339.88) TaxID=685588 RepID=A0A067SYG3_GALM3|nr:hypothetical protein GALMADRAFT_253570 [Galerina marginata CBS 339.88]
MTNGFGQATSPVAALKSILHNYPYSVGLLREIEQNSDDAGASKQVFVLDRRAHPATSLYHSRLATTQGPALLAFNDAKFVESDWYALQNTYESSKVDDSSKIGKYGVGFRSLFHITDCPQILSGNLLAMFDPLRAFTDSTGIKKDLSLISSQYPDQLTPFQWFSDNIRTSFEGTVVRCPLRTAGSRISSKVVAADDISHLFREFINEELGISLLFLHNIQKLEIYDINEEGRSTCLATLFISRSNPISCGQGNETFIATVTTTINGVVQEKTWRVLHCPFHKDSTVELLSNMFPNSLNPTAILKEHKLLANIGIATALNPTFADRTSGRLFTYLPLPLPTGFCAHIHALFALTQSRQHLRNPREIGIVPGSSDQILIGWNQLLFEHYIPLAWNQLLEVLAQSNTALDILSAWPPEQRSPATSGENVYWEFLPLNLFKFITSSKSSVWPIYQRQQSTNSVAEYLSLDQVIVANPDTSITVLGALTSMGLRLTRPPAYIVKIVKDTGNEQFSILTPEVAHSALLNHLDLLQLASKEDLLVVLGYLLSSSNILNIIGLPLVPISCGENVALLPKDAALKTHTMMNRVEFNVFGACDDSAIDLHSLPRPIADVLRIHGPKALNVETLAATHIVDYLTIYPNRMGLDLSLKKTDARVIIWLSVYWEWMNIYEHKDELFAQTRHLYLLPTTRGLRKAETPVFRSRGEHPNSVQHLSALGIPFLDADLSVTAHTVLSTLRLLKSISDIHSLLDAVPLLPPVDAQPLSQESCTTILKHISSRAQGSCILQGAFSREQIRRLRCLPIFPMVSYPAGSSVLVTEWTDIPDGLTLKSVEHPPFLPSIPNVGFVQLPTIARGILGYLEQDSSLHGHLSGLDVLSLTAENFTAQLDYVHAAALDYIVQNRYNVAPIILNTVRDAEFVTVKDGSKKKATNIIDPGSKLAPLYEENPECQPNDTTVFEKSIIRSLQSLHLMQRVLTTDVVQERINFISSNSSAPKSVNLSRSLLSLIAIERFDCSRLKVSPEQRWLPTEQGLRGPEECRDPSTLSPYFFDRVLSVLEPFSIPSSLRRVLGWDQPLAADILIKQLDRVLDNPEDAFPNVLEIVKELSARNLTDGDFGTLQVVTSDRRWVPTTEMRLSETRNAVFVVPVIESGFHQALSIDSRMQSFLLRMGCTATPSTEAIILKMIELRSQSASLNNVNVSLSLLRSVPTKLDDAERAQLLVPDLAGELRPFAETYFNDIGEHARLIPSCGDFIAHQLLDEPLARRLRIRRLGLKYADLSVPSVDMGEKPITTVRRILTQYTDKQFATEFVANAADANATEFTLLLNRFHPRPDEDLRALSPIMAKFCTSPSLVVFNNATFTDADFIGIRRTGIGGKEGKGGTIGQFGLGVLTMFHFTEMAILISNSNVLFMNPSKEHLPISDVASLMLPLNHVRQYYPSHLAAVDGLFGFDISSKEVFHGTIFLLPLREPSHCEGFSEAISHHMRGSADLEYEILDPFGEAASNCLLFTGVTRISGVKRDPFGVQQVSWCFDARRASTRTEPNIGYSTADITITDLLGSISSWRIATAVVPKEQIPHEIVSPLVEHRPRLPPTAGLAALLGDAPTKSGPFKFFSTLPLGISTSLPVHVMATFLLSSDRRGIRLDEYGTLESKFNTWILAHVIPPLYLFLLESLLQIGNNKQWWPGQHRSQEDIYSRLIINTFYSEYLKSSTRPVCQSLHNSTIFLSAQEVVLSGDEPPSVQTVLSILQSQRIARLSKGPSRLATEQARIAAVNPTFLKSEMLQVSSSMIAELDSKVVEDVLTYLLGKEEDATNLLGLPILPLENGMFGTFHDQSDSGMSYYIWRPRKKSLRHNFPPDRFVLSDLKTSQLLKLNLNISPLDAEAIKLFIEARLLPATPYEAAPDMTNWIYDFWVCWDEYAHLGLASNDIVDFPLVPTIRPNTFVSFASCKDASTVVIDGSSAESELIRAFLDNLDVNVVRAHEEHTPPALHHILRSEEFPSFNLQTVLKALLPHQNTVAATITNFDDGLKTTFASWARNNIPHTIPDELRNIAQQLPIWPSASSGSTLDLRPASEVYMLPEGLALDTAARFMNVLVAEYGSLRLLNGHILPFVQFRDKLGLPANLSATELAQYKELLSVWILELPPSYTEPLPVPNCNGAIKLSNELYARQPLFEAAFGDDSPFFVHPDYQDLEDSLRQHGIRTQNQLDVPMFIDCVVALNAREGDDIVARASVLFEAYGFSLPMRIESHRFRELDDFTFIPRDMSTRRRLEDQLHTLPGLDTPSNVTALSEIVTPTDLIRKEFEAVAWTQRALFADQPNSRVVLAYPELGRPSISEVVAHLRVLASLRDLSPSQRRIVAHDVEQTYSFLNDNVAAAESVLVPLGGAEIFLNVDHPETDVWRWDKADELVFETQDVDENIRHVRGFLLPFGKLLRAAGVLQVYHPQYPASQPIDDSELKLVSIRSGFEELRRKNALTDVAFVASDHEENSEPLVAHRSFLAVSSEYFADSFCAGFSESRPASSEAPIIFNVSEYSTACVLMVLDYIYTGNRPSAELSDLDLLLQALQLSGYWQVLDLFEDLQRQIAVRMITPRTLDKIRNAAEMSNAEKLLQTCVEYEDKNPDLISKFASRHPGVPL